MSSGCTRRSFAESLALAALAPAIGLRPDALGGTRGMAELASLVHGAPEPGALAKALAGVIQAQYGSRLSRGDLDTITHQIQSSLDRAAQIRKVDLANGDEPDFVFSAIRRADPSR